MPSRSFGVALAVLLVVGCDADPTVSGLAPGEGHGSLIVLRTDNVAGALPRRATVDLETGATRALISWFPDEREAFAGDPFASDIVLSRDGQWLAWVEFRRDTIRRYQDSEGNWRSDQHVQRLYVARVGSSTRTLITPEFHSDYSPSFSPDGRRLVLLREFFDGDNQMVTVGRDGDDVQPVLIKRAQGRGAPDWSPAGDRIVYYRPDRVSLYVLRPDGSDPLAIPSIPGMFSDPIWSPAGDRFAIVRATSNQGRDLMFVRADGTTIGSVPMTGFTGSDYPGYAMAPFAWSPDGSKVAYCAMSAMGGNSRVVRVLTIATGEDRVITPAGYNDCNPIWRP